MLLLWLFVGFVSVLHCCSGDNGLLRSFAPGDIIIGGLFPVHLKTNRSEKPGPLSCSDYDVSAFLHTQVMIYAISQINQSRLLPNLTLGYDIYDTCGDVSFALLGTLQLLGNLSDPKTKVVIGERYSEVSVAVARLLALSSVTQISYASTSEALSNKMKFPTFLRTIPSDEHQTEAIAELVKIFNWKTVVIIGSDDAYGKYGSDTLQKLFNEYNICIEFITILPDGFSLNNSQTSNNATLNKLVTDIKESIAEAIIVFSKDTNVYKIMGAAIEHKLNRTWIASDSWSTSTSVSLMTNLAFAGQVFGFISKRNEVPGFKDYVMSKFSGTTNNFTDPLESRSEVNCTAQDWAECLIQYIDHDNSYNIYLAVQVILDGLRRLLMCDDQQCKRENNFTAEELFMKIKEVNVSVNTTNIFFNENGDPSLGYDILYWNMTGSKQHADIITIGEYLTDGKINITYGDAYSNQNVSIYNCYKTCKPGEQLKAQSKTCCYKCVACLDGYYSRGNGTSCQNCNSTQYSSPEKDECLDKPAEFLRWFDPVSIILICFGVLGIIVTIVFAVLFTMYRRTPVVKAVGGYLCFLELLSLLICFCLTFTFMGKPTTASCILGLPVFAIAFSLCISCILANLLQILVGFSFDLNLGSWIKKLNQPVAVVTIASGIQLALFVSWLWFYTPKPHQDVSDNAIQHECSKGSTVCFIVTIGYNAFLGIICLIFAFKGRKLPDLYKNASLITISMLLFLIIWVLFIQIYISKFGKEKTAIESGGILISSYSILCCHLAPKCYIMVFRKEINNENAITEYIRKHYEQKGMTVMRS